MSEQTLNIYLNSFMRAVDECISGVETSLNTLIKQSKINKRQARVNLGFSFLALLTASCIVNQNKKIKKLNRDIKHLKKAVGESRRND